MVDRTNELIKYKGMQVAPAELEALLLTHPAILDAAVIRKADEEAGDVPKAFVVLKPDEAARATPPPAIMAFVAERVAPHKRIRDLEVIDQIPKSASGEDPPPAPDPEGARARGAAGGPVGVRGRGAG
jgi:acyl-coenzyme A synthetase/AMP-(fatty) acid ligase